MTLLTLPAWIVIGQTVQSSANAAVVYTIAGICNMNTLNDSFVRIERQTEHEYVSQWVVLWQFLRDWRAVEA